MKNFWRQGEQYVWASGAALALTLLFTLLLLFVIIYHGLGTFWPSSLVELTLKDGKKVLGEIHQIEEQTGGKGQRIQLKVGNRDLYGADFRWISQSEILKVTDPQEALVVERQEYGNFYGYLRDIRCRNFKGVEHFEAAWEAAKKEFLKQKKIEDEMVSLNYELESISEKILKIQYSYGSEDPRLGELRKREGVLKKRSQKLVEEQTGLLKEVRKDKGLFFDASGRKKEIALVDLVRVYQPNSMGFFARVGLYVTRLFELLFENPRESNTEGGLFPAIFGTVMLVFLMSLFSFPLGVIGGIYLREYARQGPLVRAVRIAVNNLAGIPSIVYGIFGLGFFIYGIGGSLDQIFFPHRLPAPTFGTGGILWASLTLGLLTVPIVIVATEEALGTIPREICEGSYALGATQFQTLWRNLLPMASPGIMTGLILAMARAAGEVAPLMITGVVKLAPSLPLDGHFPFFHLDRKFMHLGFHIYDVGFQSPNVEAAKPMVYVTAFLLLLVVLFMNSVAIYLRNRLKKRYTKRGI